MNKMYFYTSCQILIWYTASASTAALCNDLHKLMILSQVCSLLSHKSAEIKEEFFRISSRQAIYLQHSELLLLPGKELGI